MASQTASGVPPLLNKAKSIEALLSHFTTILNTRTTTDPKPEEEKGKRDTITKNEINPFHLLRDTATLLRSHTTKLSLLLITPPFTPSAILSVLTPCETQVIPAMMSGWQVLNDTDEDDNHKYYSSTVIDGIKKDLKDVVAGFSGVMALVIARCTEKKVATTSTGRSKESSQVTESFKADVLSATGILWDACDKLKTTVNLDIPGIIARKVEAFRAILDDAIEELREWGVVQEPTPPVTDDDEEDEEGVRSDEEADSNEEEEGNYNDDEIDPFLESTLPSLPANRSNLRKQHKITMKELRLISTFYKAIVKHRLKTLPLSSSSSSSAATSTNSVLLEKSLKNLSDIPDKVDDLAAAFYEGDEDEVENGLRKIVEVAKEVGGFAREPFFRVGSSSSSPRGNDSAPSKDGDGSKAELLRENDKDKNGFEDVFSVWVGKWDVAVSEALMEGIS